MLNDFLGQFKQKHDGSQHPCLAAMKHFRPKLSRWQDLDELRLSLHAETESNFGWGSVSNLGIITSLDNRPLLSYALAGGSNMNYQGTYQLQAETTSEEFTFVVVARDRADVYYKNYPIGFINPVFTAFDLQGNIVLRCATYEASLLSDYDGGAANMPAQFQFSSGCRGWYNIPSGPQCKNSPNDYPYCRAMGVSFGQLHDYERRWMIALWIFLRVGPWSREKSYRGKLFDWGDILGDIMNPFQ